MLLLAATPLAADTSELTLEDAVSTAFTDTTSKEHSIVYGALIAADYANKLDPGYCAVPHSEEKMIRTIFYEITVRILDRKEALAVQDYSLLKLASLYTLGYHSAWQCGGFNPEANQ